MSSTFRWRRTPRARTVAAIVALALITQRAPVAPIRHNRTDTTPRWLGAAGLLLGALGVGIGGGGALLRSRRSTTGAKP